MLEHEWQQHCATDIPNFATCVCTDIFHFCFGQTVEIQGSTESTLTGHTWQFLMTTAKNFCYFSFCPLVISWLGSYCIITKNTSKTEKWFPCMWVEIRNEQIYVFSPGRRFYRSILTWPVYFRMRWCVFIKRWPIASKPLSRIESMKASFNRTGRALFSSLSSPVYPNFIQQVWLAFTN